MKNISDQSNQTGLTGIEIGIQLGCYGLLGILSLIGNGAMGIGILKQKNLRRSGFFIILWFLLITRFLLSGTYVSIFVYRSLLSLKLVNLRIERIWCYLIHMGIYFAPMTELVLILGLVLDRILAMCACRWYQTLKYTQTIVTCSILFFSSLTFKITTTFLSWSNNKTDVYCISGMSPMMKLFGDTFSLAYPDITLVILILILYIGLILYVHFRVVPVAMPVDPRALRNTNVSGYRRKFKLLAVLKRLVLIHCALTILSKGMISVSALVTLPGVTPRCTAYGAMLMAFELFINVVILIKDNSTLRHSSFSCLNFNGAHREHDGL